MQRLKQARNDGPLCRDEDRTLSLLANGIAAPGSSAKSEIAHMAPNKGQAGAIMHILHHPDKILGVQGYAGVGKTFALKLVNDIAGLYK